MAGCKAYELVAVCVDSISACAWEFGAEDRLLHLDDGAVVIGLAQSGKREMKSRHSMERDVGLSPLAGVHLKRA